MPNPITLIRRLFRREIYIPAVAVGPGDGLIFAPGQLPASIDAVFLLNTLHEQFPGVRLHLITGFPGIQVIRKPGSSKSSYAGKGAGANPSGEAKSQVRIAIPKVLKPTEQRPVVVARRLSGPVINISLIPPEQEGDAPKEFHVSARGDVGGFVYPSADCAGSKEEL